MKCSANSAYRPHLAPGRDRRRALYLAAGRERYGHRQRVHNRRRLDGRKIAITQKRRAGLLGFCPKVLHSRLGAERNAISRRYASSIPRTVSSVRPSVAAISLLIIAPELQCQHLLLPRITQLPKPECHFAGQKDCTTWRAMELEHWCATTMHLLYASRISVPGARFKKQGSRWHHFQCLERFWFGRHKPST